MNHPAGALLALFLTASAASAQQLTVADVSPAGGASSTTGPATIAITFSADVDAVTISGSTISVVRAGPDTVLHTLDDIAIVPASITVTGAVVTLDMAGTAWVDDSYAIRISGRGVAPTPHAGLFGHWSLDEGTGPTAGDASGNDRHGAVNGPTWSTGLFGSALVFGGGAPRVDIDAGLLFPNWTASLWVHRSADVMGTAGTLMDRVSTTTNTSLRLEQSAGDDVGFTEYTVADYGSGFVAPIGSWTHLVFTCDGANLRVYANGVLVDSSARNSELSVDKLGSSSILRSNSLHGVLDEVQVYSRVLTDPEIAALAGISGCVRSTTGRILDGDTVATLPSGDGVEGGDFVSTFAIAPQVRGGSGGSGCGALGVEGPMIWLAILLFRRRRSGR